MKTFDGRTYSHEMLEKIRIAAVKRVEAGECPNQVIKSLGFAQSCIYRWLAASREGGEEALKAKKLFGRPPKISGNVLQKLYTIIAKETPQQYRFPFALWTVEIIREILRKVFNIAVSSVTTWRVLRKLGLTPQKPLFRAYQQRPEEVKKYLEEEYPLIKKRAKRCNAKIFFEDEASMRSDFHAGTTWAPRGKTPVVKTTGARFKVNMISAISAQGEMRFMVHEGGVDADVFIGFLKRLVAGQDTPIFLILDGHPVHKSVKVKNYVTSLGGKLELYFLPPYSPELNPDETVWSYVKHHKVGKQIITGPDQLKSLVRYALFRLSRMPQRIKNFFRQRELRYAM
jgi:transposase